ncbi:MAG: hypothetical protein ABI691_18885 [Ginsengibacter sp.]
MENRHELKLIEGKFSPAEARKVISDLISSKINYHNMEAFSIKERFNGDTSYSEKRIKELKEARKSLEDIVGYAAGKGLKLKVESVIEVIFIQEN